jgi:hypothetical protein
VNAVRPALPALAVIALAPLAEVGVDLAGDAIIDAGVESTPALSVGPQVGPVLPQAALPGWMMQLVESRAFNALGEALARAE